MPGLSDTHSRLAYRRSDHADNAIAEVRTALSVDPKNAEAYPFLGSVCTPTASIRPPSMPSRNHWLASRTAPTFTTTWELLSAPGAILTRPQPACRKAIALNPQFWVAHNNLGMLLYDMRRFAEYLKARRLVPEEFVRNNLGNTYCDKGDYAAVIVEFGDSSGWIPVGSLVIVVCLGPSCAIVELSWPFCRIQSAPMSIATSAKLFFSCTGNRRPCANCAWRFT
jgi:hypothetical protein